MLRYKIGILLVRVFLQFLVGDSEAEIKPVDAYDGSGIGSAHYHAAGFLLPVQILEGADGYRHAHVKHQSARFQFFLCHVILVLPPAEG